MAIVLPQRVAVTLTHVNVFAHWSPSSRSVSVRNYGDPIAADPPGGWGGWGLGKPDRTVWPTARLSVAGTPVPTYDDGFPKAPPHPARPLRGAHGRIDDSSGKAL